MQATQDSPTLADRLGVPKDHQGSGLRLQSTAQPIGRINGEPCRFEKPALTKGDVVRLTREEEQARSRHSRQFVRF